MITNHNFKALPILTVQLLIRFRHKQIIIITCFVVLKPSLVRAYLRYYGEITI